MIGSLFLLPCVEETEAQEEAGTELENRLATCLSYARAVAKRLVWGIEPWSSKLLTCSVPPTSRH